MQEDQLYADTIYLVVHGSRAYGTHRPESDRDEKGVCVLRDSRYYFGNLNFEQKDKEWSDGVDRSIMDIRKFVRLALTCNPNIIEMLYADESDILKMDGQGQRLRDNRDIFLSRIAKDKFVGYALSQLKRLRGHYEWLQNPPEQPDRQSFWKIRKLTRFSDPVRLELGGHEFEIIANAEADADWLVNVRHFDGNSYDAAKRRYQNYTKWRKERNPDRAAIEAEHGYDLKFAYHLVRLLRMGKEIISDGQVLVKRPDAAELLEIRNGKFSYEELVAYAEQLASEIDALVDKSPLPEVPDFAAAEKLTMDLIRERLTDSLN